MASPPLPDVFGNYAIRGIQEVLPPEPVSWWPQTPGWLVIAALLVAWLGRRGWLAWRRWQRNRYRRDALDALATLGGEPAMRLQAAAAILKLAALSAHPRPQVAGLSGQAWLDWLESQYAAFSDSSRRLLAETQYRPAVSLQEVELDRLVQECAVWVRRHPEPAP